VRILVTGATGFIGRHLAAALAGGGHTVISASRARVGPPEASTHVSFDVASLAPFPDVGHVDSVVHLAGNGNTLDAWKRPAEVAQVNAQGTLRAIEVAMRSDAGFILASSQRVYQPGPEPLSEDDFTRPTDPYGYTKLCAERYVEMAGRLFGLRGSVLRFFSVYGPGQRIASGQSGVVALFGQRALHGEPLVVKSHEMKDFMDVSDAVEGICAALSRPTTPPRTYNIATGTPTSVLQLARVVKAATRSASEIVEDYSEGDPGGLVARIDRARTELGFYPRITLTDGVRRYADWLAAAGPDPAESAAD